MTVRWRGRHVFDVLVADKIEGGLLGEIGNVYHVNTASATYPGKDSNSGLSYEYPLLTITAALGKCVANRNDYILIHDYWQASGETWPIVVNKNKAHIIGVAQPNLPFPAIHPTGNTGAFILGSAGQYSEIAYLTIGGGNSYGGILLTYDGTTQQGQVDGVWIHRCTFGHQWFGTPLNGIQKLAAANRPSHSVLIEENEFFGDLASGKGVITGNAIDLLSATDSRAVKNFVIRYNVFMGTAIAINLVRGYDAEIYGNKYVVPNAQNGEAVSLGSNCLSCLVDENRAMYGMLNNGYSYNPYRDLASNTTNHWGSNYRGGALVEPVGV